MATPYLGEIRIMSFAFPPTGWALCDGQLLPINQNQALFSLLGSRYGGDGHTNFGLPDLRGRVPFHVGNGLTLGQRGGEDAHTLTGDELATHTHAVAASPNAADQSSPAGAHWADGGLPAYAASGSSSLSPQAVGATGGSQAHENWSPARVVSFCIALQGIFPAPN